MRIHWPICFLFYCFSMIVHAYPYQEVLPDGVRLSLVAEKLSDQTELLGSAPSSQLFPPASTLKVVTALAAKLELGDSFTFATSLSKANDDLVMSFSGDPTLTSKDLSNLLDQLKENGITEIKGNVWLDDAMFVGYDRAVGWPWDILGVCYSAPASAITLNENCVQASIYTQDNGKTRVFVPEHQPIHVSTSAITVSKSAQKAKHCDLDLIAHSSNQYELKGCLVKRDKPLPLKFAVQDPRAYTSRVVYTLLRQKGIKLHGQVLIGAPANGINTKLIASHHSKALPALLEEMLKRSDNLIADTLTKTLGHHFYIQPGSFRNGTEAIKQIIFANTSIDIKNAQLEDGSGLSRNNRISAASMADILRYIWKHDKELNLIAIMPKSGESGTLKYRQSMRKAPIKGQLIAKSGSLYGTYNMAGYGLDKNGKPNTLFVQFVSDYFPEKRDANKPVIAPITRFEKLFYQDIVNFSQAMPKK